MLDFCPKSSFVIVMIWIFFASLPVLFYLFLQNEVIYKGEVIHQNRVKRKLTRVGVKGCLSLTAHCEWPEPDEEL